MEETIDSLRALAPRWSLAGDEKLLNLLQTTHQRIVSKCREVNTRLAEMETALGEASINLQNVNNKFLALSNSQFIESRVYDDDADITTDTKPIEERTEPETLDQIVLLKQSLSILDNAHETTEIYDDSETDSDAEISVVLKPKDAYIDRPLPYIMGSQAWKNKWHSGLIIEDSDTDSDISQHDVRDIEQFSESDDDIRTDKLVPDTTISESGSLFHSERDKDLSIPEMKQTPAAVAAELAARLGNAPPRVLEEPDGVIGQSTSRTVYRPEKPISSTIFSDEPPPIEKDAYEKETYEQYASDSQDEDIFAEINKKQPYNASNTAHNDLADDLFGRKVFDDELNSFKSKESKAANQNSPLFEDEYEPELFVEKPKAKDNTQSVRNEQESTKKPVGGISLFGSNKGTESIGAAILKRNRRKSSPSDSESDLNNKNTIKNDSASESENENINANDIFDNLFAKAKQAEQKSVKPVKVDRPVKEKAPKQKEVKDLFSDNIFDDIDDIFTTNIKIPTKESNKNTKSIFDDDDDLFSDIAKPKDTKDTKPNDTKPTTSKKSIFDSDDELFSDVKVSKEIPKNDKAINIETPVKANQIIRNEKLEKVKDTESQVTKTEETNINTAQSDIIKDSIISDDSKSIESKESVKPKVKSKSIFDSDSDEDLFSDKIKTQPHIKVSSSIANETDAELFKGMKEAQDHKKTGALKPETSKDIQSPSLFEEDEIDDLFINANKANEAKMSSVNTIIDTVITKDILGFENKSKVTKETSIFKENTSKLDEILKVPEDILKIDNKKSGIVDTKPQIEERDPKSDKKDITNTESENTKLNIPESADDIIETSQEPINVQIESSSMNAAVESDLHEPNQIKTKTKNDTKKETLLPEPQEPVDKSNTNPQDIPIFDEVSVKEKQDLIPEQKSLISVPFDDIFKEPPVFEKTKETKKTVNVNALFEDDSDDEALFFKKNDVISDEKPEIFSPSANFGLFDDEPPAFVDFNSQVNDKFDDDDLFSSIPKDSKTSNVSNEPPDLDERNDEPIKQDKTTQKLSDNENNLFSSTETTKVDTTVKTAKEIPDSDEELFSNIPKVPEASPKEITFEKHSTDQLDEAKPKNIKTDTDAKKIGKLNTNNFNINVQALVPGASPKKISKERIHTVATNKDTITVKESKTSNEELTEVDNAKDVKTISFETKPESGVLDNNLSKQRPRIQVKRRPSSRRARHEAVRKSVIDIDDDTDNSSSFDEPLPKITNQVAKSKVNELKNQDGVTKISITELISNENKNKDVNKEIVTEHKNSDSQKDFDYIDEMLKTKDKNQNVDKVEDPSVHKASYIQKDFENTDKTFETENKNQNIGKVEKPNEQSTTNIQKYFEDVDELFKTDDETKNTVNIHDEITKNRSQDELDSKETANVDTNLNQKVVESEESTSTTKVVYILNDEDIFSNTKNQENKNELLQNTKEPDDDDLFKSSAIKTIGNTYKDTNKNIDSAKADISDRKAPKATQSNETKVKESSKTVQPTKSVFDLSDDDDDLFGKTKTKKVEVKSKLFESDSEDDLFDNKKKNKKVDQPKKEEKVKGSLFGDDEDDDLFGVKSKTTQPTKVSASSRPREAVRPTNTVFDDPLSLLDDD